MGDEAEAIGRVAALPRVDDVALVEDGCIEPCRVAAGRLADCLVAEVVVGFFFGRLSDDGFGVGG